LDIQQLINKYQELYAESFQQLCREKQHIKLHGLTGSSLSLFIAANYFHVKGFHLIILPDKETAAYVYNDLENLLDDVGIEYHRKKVMFYPSAYKRPYETDHPDNAKLRNQRSDFGQFPRSAVRKNRVKKICFLSYYYDS